MLSNNEKFQTITEISLLTNKWAMWADTCLENSKTYVPAVYQLRDAYYHLISALSVGLSEIEPTKSTEAQSGDTALIGALNSDDIQIVGRFWTESTVVSEQLTEMMHHSSRAFFDTVDYIFHELLAYRKDAINYKVYYSLDQLLPTYIKGIHNLREKKAATGSDILSNVNKWNFLLSVITDAYTFADNVVSLDKVMDDINMLFAKIEAKCKPETIRNVCPDFYKLKTEFIDLAAYNGGFELMTKFRDVIDNIAKDPSYELSQEQLIECEENKEKIESICQARETRIAQILEELKKMHALLYSTTIMYKSQSFGDRISNITWAIIELLVMAYPTYLVDKKLLVERYL